MKNTKITKLLSILISCLLIIGAMVGIAAAAEEASENGGNVEDSGSATPTATATIKYKNLSYGAANKLVFYVKGENLTEGQTVRVLFYSSEQAEYTVNNADYAVESAGTLTVNEADGNGGTAPVSYDAYLSREIAPVDMRKPIYAVPAVFDADGTAIYFGEALKYSVFDYVVAGFAKNPGEDQKALYTALLNFGASVQKALLEAGVYSQEELDKVGYANAYLNVQAEIYVDGKLVTTDNYYHGFGETVEVEVKKLYQSSLDLDENGVNDTLAFYGYLDDEGNLKGETNEYGALTTLAKPETVSMSATEVDESAKIKLAYYLSQGKLVDYENGGALADYGITTKNLKDTLPEDDAKGSWAFITDGDSIGLDSSVLRHGKNEMGSGKGSRNITYSVSPLTTGSTVRYVFETDLYYGIDSSGSTGQRMNIHFMNGAGNDLYALIINQAKNNTFAINSKNEGQKSNPNMHNQTITTVNAKQWVNIRVEYYPIDVQMDTSFADTDALIFIYVDGELRAVRHDRYRPSGATAANPDDSFKGIYFEMTNGGGNQLDVYYDNTYVATEYVYSTPEVEEPDTPENPDEPVVLPNKYIDFGITENFDEFAKEDYNYTVSSGNLVPDLSAVDNLNYTTIGTEENGNKYFEMGMKNYKGGGTSTFYSAVDTGDIYIAEFDYMFLDCDQTKSWTTKIQILNGADSEIFNITLQASATGVSFAGKTLKKGEWHTIRLEYNPNFSDSVTATRFVNVYIDGEFASKVEGRDSNDWRKSDAVFGGIGINFRQNGSYPVTNNAFRLDNLFVSAINLDDIGGGENKNNANGFDYTGDYKDMTAEQLGFVAGEGLLGADKTAEGTKGWITVEKDINNNNVLEIAGKGNAASVTVPATKHDGNKYTFETDLYVGAYKLAEAAEGDVLATISLLGATYDKATDTYTSTGAILPVTVRAGAFAERADVCVGDTVVASVWTNTWYNIKVEYVVSDVVDGETTTNAGLYNIYINGESVAKNVTYNAAGTVENNLYYGVEITVAGAGVEALVAVDNVYTKATYQDYKDKGDVAGSGMSGVITDNVTVESDTAVNAQGATNADIYVTELDIKWLGSDGVAEGAADAWFLEMSLVNANGGKMITLYGKIDPDNFGYLDISLNKKDVLATLPADTWHNILIKYVAGEKIETTEGETTTVEYAYSFELYLNGEKLADGEAKGAVDNTTFSKAEILFGANVVSPALELDNVFVGAIDLDNLGNGANASDKKTEDYERTNLGKLDISASEGLLNADKTLANVDGWICIETETNVKTNGWITVEAGLTNSVLEISKKVSEAKATFLPASAEGNTFVFETDLKWMGSVSGIADDQLTNAVFFSYAVESAKGAVVTVYGICEAGNYDTVILSTSRSLEDGFATISKGVWYNLSVVYTPASKTVGDGESATTTYTGSYVITLDGVKVAEAKDVACADDNSTYAGTTVTLHYDDSIYDAAVRMDNTYVSAITVEAPAPEAPAVPDENESEDAENA